MRALRVRTQRASTPPSPVIAEDQVVSGLVDKAFQDLASLVSARGLCARMAGMLAHLPDPDLDLISAACQCLECAERRLH